jgi:hypothetical protein
MTKSATKFQNDFDAKSDELFEKYPEIQKLMHSLDTTLDRFESAVSTGKHLQGGERIAHDWSCMIDAQFGFVDAMHECCPTFIDRAKFSQQILEIWDKNLPRPIPLGEKRAIHVSVAYKSGFRPNLVGSKDTPMEAALQVASLIERLPLETGPEAIRKSIQRFRDGLAGVEMFRLNRETLKLEVFQAKTVLLDGLPNRRGRPLSRKSEQRKTTAVSSQAQN